ncbi:MAG: hypothetical protein FWG77_09530 [Treponema sp.]|nr:hypothetical protein [Treponema sp.]
MKKALVILILLAFVGGGLFAQTIQWNGYLQAGLGIRSIAGHDDLYWGMITPQVPNAGTRFHLQFRWTSAAENAGIDASFRAAGNHAELNGIGLDTTGNPFLGFHVPYFLGWLTGFDNMIRLQAGRFWGGQTPLATVDWLVGDDDFAGYGMMATVYPVDGLRFGFGMITPGSVAGFTGITQNSTWEDRPFTAWLGARYMMSGVFGATANFRVQYENMNATLSFTAPIIPIVDLSGVLWLNRIDDFGDAGSMNAVVNLVIPYGIVMDDFRFGVHGRFIRSNLEANENPYLGVMAWADYRMDSIFPRVELGYATGGSLGAGATSFGTWVPIYRYSPSYNNDNAFMYLRPSVAFRVAANQHLEVGATIAIDQGAGGNTQNISVGGALEQGTSVGLWATFQLSF